ncbi:hypothetical protein P7C73_g6259, partial [Tremellales sp. Uapishka_1]
MTFITNIAGPSRLPIRAATRVVLARRHASTAAEQVEPAVEGENEVEAVSSDERPRASGEGYQRWLETVGARYHSADQGKAQWLGGVVPFASNPSFRPPPPLSNDLQDVIYAATKRQDKTIGQLAESYNVSKARIQAITKLKQVEAEYRRQSKPLQHAFLAAMEPLLDVKSPFYPHSTKLDTRAERDERYLRDAHPGSSAEKLEEVRWESGMGEGGAFGQGTPRNEGMERAVWEFRDEDEVIREKKVPAAPATLAVRASKTTVPRSDEAKSGFRFIDTSSKKTKRVKGGK